MNLRKLLCRFPEPEPAPVHVPVFRRQMTDEDLRRENLGKRVWYLGKDAPILCTGVFVGYTDSIIVAEDKVDYCGRRAMEVDYCGRRAIEVDLKKCWIELEEEEGI